MKRLLRIGILPVALSLAAAARADDKAAAAAPDAQASLKSDNKQLSDELAAAWKESAELKAKLDQMTAGNASLSQQLEAAKAAQAAPAAPVPDSDLAKQVADLQDKLSTSLRSFSVIQDENTQLKASVDKANSDNAALAQQLEEAKSSIATLQVQAAETSKIPPLRDELRQAQDESTRLASENAQLRTHLALQSTGPGSSRPAPLRPGQPQAVAAAQPAPPPAPEVRTYVVAEGDTLTKISRKFYGTSARWEEILKANHDVMKDEKSLVVGSTIKIP